MGTLINLSVTDPAMAENMPEDPDNSAMRITLCNAIKAEACHTHSDL